MQVNPVSIEESAGHGGATHIVEISHADLTEEADATAEVIDIGPVVAKQSVKLVHAELVEAFKDENDADNNSTLVKLGDGSNDARFMANTEMNENGTEVPLSHGTGTQNVYSADATLKATFTPGAGKDLEALTHGKVRFWLLITDARRQ